MWIVDRDLCLFVCLFCFFCSWMFLLEFGILPFCIIFLFPIYHPSIYQFGKKMYLILLNLVLFTTICSKYTQLMLIGHLRLCDENLPIAIPKNPWKTPQNAGTYTYTMSMWYPLPSDMPNTWLVNGMPLAFIHTRVRNPCKFKGWVMGPLLALFVLALEKM